MKKAELLSAIRANLEQHRKAFLEAQQGYCDEVIAQLDATLAQARAGRPFQLQGFVQLTAPQDHTRDYQRVIKMLEMSIADDVIISEAQFQQYVMDDWSWKRDFVTTNARYSKT